MTMVSIGQDPENAIVLATYEYSENNGHLDYMSYGNDDYTFYSYDELDRLTEEQWNGGTTYQYFYNSEGALSKKVDTATGNAVNYEYDSIGRLIHSSVTENGSTTMLTEHLYDRQNRIKEQSYQIRNSDETFKTYSFAYTYRGSDGLLEKFESTDNYIDAYTLGYDALARLEKRTNSYFVQNYAYADALNGTDTTTQIESIDYDAGKYATNFAEFTLTYGYDALGNILTIENSANSSDNRTYAYDIQGQLLTETIGNQTNSYTYDTYGNIRTATVDGTTHTYTYTNLTWRDLLTAYDGQPFAYEGQQYTAEGRLYGTPLSGNPVSYYNGTRWTFDWEKGRQLVSASGNGKTITYTYDMAGIRDSKTVNGVTYHYDTLNGKVVRQTWTEGTKERVFEIIYDASGLPYACVYEGSRYYYVLNQQGDVIRIVGYLGATLCEYQYDAWGNVLSITGTYKDTIGKVNPIRYRGYYYDTDTGFYYLQSRYYDPSIGRFINADSFASTGQGFLGNNMFANCNNNPCNFSDPNGHMIQGRSEYGPNAMTYKGGGKVYCTPHWLIEEEKPGTLAVGISGTFSRGGFVGTISLGLTIDRNWNIAWMGSRFLGTGVEKTTVDSFVSVTNAPHIERQSGGTSHMGGAIGDYSGEYFNFRDEDGNMYHGLAYTHTLWEAGTAPISYHVGTSGTVVGSFYDVLLFLLLGVKFDEN